MAHFTVNFPAAWIERYIIGCLSLTEYYYFLTLKYGTLLIFDQVLPP